MFDEEKVKKDLEKMRNAYQKTMKKFDEIEERQKVIAKLIYQNKIKNQSK